MYVGGPLAATGAATGRDRLAPGPPTCGRAAAEPGSCAAKGGPPRGRQWLLRPPLACGCGRLEARWGRVRLWCANAAMLPCNVRKRNTPHPAPHLDVKWQQSMEMPGC